MRKKKTNPNRIPVSWSAEKTQQATDEATREMVLLSWSIVLCVLADRWDTTSEKLLDFWNTMNNSCSKLRDLDDIESRLTSLTGLTGCQFPFHRISALDIRTQGDADRLRRKLRDNALSSMFALISDTILIHGLMDKEGLCHLFVKAQSMLEDLARGDISQQDLLGVLVDEFSLRLYEENNNVVLRPIEGVDTLQSSIICIEP